MQRGCERCDLVTWIILTVICSMCQADQSQREEVVCQNMDIRNSPSQLDKLRNCTVIEGHLKILLIDYGSWEDFESRSYPNLVEITDYFLLYRVKGLRSLRNLFPNLTVIKGQNLFFNYGLVVFEMFDLVELGLPSLTTIVRGAVRIEKNSLLCYIHTIDWTQIAHSSTVDDHFIIQNKDPDECVDKCPEGQCPTARIENENRRLCWTSEDCQKVKSQATCKLGETSWDGKICCHEECVGGCTGPLPTSCVACRNVFHYGRCQQRCNPGTYMYKRRRCISEMECKAFNKLLVPHEQKCLDECPAGFTSGRTDQHICVPCSGPCPKKCASLNVDSVAAAQKLKGCTVIEGVLKIQIGGGTGVGKELEENLGQIEEIDHYLKIQRSYALMSLSFLKNLRRINGVLLHNGRHAMVVLDNQNLQDIWDINTHPRVNFTVNPKASVFFQGNRKLCLYKIQQLVAASNLKKNTDDKDISQITNGDQVTCNYTEIKVIVQSGAKYAVVKFSNFRVNDQRELLNFVVNYREAPYRNITKFSARDACSTDIWKSEDARPNYEDKDVKEIFHILYQLKPYTQYALYVNTYMIASARLGGMSDIIYFTTEPDTPTTPTKLQLEAKNEGELILTWQPPSTPNGNVTHYLVYWQDVPLQPQLFDQRNYCEDKLKLITNPESGDNLEPSKKDNGTEPEEKMCKCKKNDKEKKEEEEERLFQIEFENYLHNSVYQKRPMRKRSRRSTFEEKLMSYEESVNTTELIETRETAKPNTTYQMAVVYHKTYVVMPTLKHFQEYNIEVIACHDYNPMKKETLCSNRAIITGRTKRKERADDLDELSIQIVNKSQGTVELKWADPSSPNGLIVTYEIEYKAMNIKNVRPINTCISHKAFRERFHCAKRSVGGPVYGGYVLDKLAPGNYSFRIRATSLAGNGSWTKSKYFFVADSEGSTVSTQVGLIAGITASASFILILLVSGSVWYVAKRRFNPNIPDGVLYASVNPEYMCADAYVPDEWEVLREKITIMNELGQGSFGMVYEGIAHELSEDRPDEVRVAVKTVNENASVRDRIEFLHEASVMKAFNCNHVVKLLGVVSKGQPTLVIMELMANGDLKKYLRLHRPDEQEENSELLPPPSLKKILQMSAEICDGMAYLAGKKFVHRDLAARNCMVAEDLTVKIGDFGMTRDIYETDYYRKGGKGLLPVRWMAPESLKDGVFTSMSDVWSFGVVLWEMATLAAQPYQGLANEQVLKYVIDGGIMEKPEGCPDRLYDLMKLCWRHNPKQRPNFCEIIEMLVPELEPPFKDKSFFFSDENTYISDQEEEKQDMDDSFTPLTQNLHPHTDSESSLNTTRSHPPAPPPRDSQERLESAELMSGDVYCQRYPSLSSHSQNNGVESVDILENEVKVKRSPSNTNCRPAGTLPGSSDGSKSSSKSSGSNSSYSHINGIINGHLPVYSLRHQTTC